MVELLGILIAVACFALAFLADLGAGPHLMSAATLRARRLARAARVPPLRALPGRAAVSGQGIAQILVYIAFLLRSAIRSGRYMAWVYSERFRAPRWLAAPSAALPSRRRPPEREQDWKAYAKTAFDPHGCLRGAPLRAPAPAGSPAAEPRPHRGGARRTSP